MFSPITSFQLTHLLLAFSIAELEWIHPDAAQRFRQLPSTQRIGQSE